MLSGPFLSHVLSGLFKSEDGYFGYLDRRSGFKNTLKIGETPYGGVYPFPYPFARFDQLKQSAGKFL